MRFMKWIGLLAAILLLYSCFIPWVYIHSKNITVTGVNSTGTNFGSAGYFHFIMTFLFTIFHFINRVWAKRWNLLVVGLNLAWAIRNYFVISACRAGECPEKETGLYLSLIASILILVSALFPDMEISKRKEIKSGN